jgi:hypothetical protein
MILGAPDQYLNRGKHDVSRAFEKEVSKELPENVGLLCWYRKDSLSNLSLTHMIELLVDHEYTIRSNWRYKQWDANKIINVLSKGIDNSLGDGSTILLFETMMSVFKLNKDNYCNK